MSQEQQHNSDDLRSQISPKILKSFADLLKVESSTQVNYELEPIAGCGENSYGAVLKVRIEAKNSENSTPTTPPPLNCVLKIAPKNVARRSFMRVVDYYKREVFVYAQIFDAYRRICAAKAIADTLEILPKMLAYSLDECEEFIIFEDLSVEGFASSSRKQLATYEMVEATLTALAKFHALSFALQATEPQPFAKIRAQLLPDNLFTPDIPAVSIEFGKSYLRRAREMFEEERKVAKNASAESEKYFVEQLRVLSDVEAKFKEIGVSCVDGAARAPYAVVCHGDFWINNIMNKYEPNTKRVLATKLVDFQMSRYASPVLDLVHYLFICLDGDMRKKHLTHFLNEIYYETLTLHLKSFDLNAEEIYPRSIFHSQFKSHGAYGLCMAAFSLPFFVADQADLIDMDKVSETVKDLAENENAAGDGAQNQIEQANLEAQNNQKVVEEFDLLTSKTAPVFKRRMLAVVDDIIEHKIQTKF